MVAAISYSFIIKRKKALINIRVSEKVLMKSLKGLLFKTRSLVLLEFVKYKLIWHFNPAVFCLIIIKAIS